MARPVYCRCGALLVEDISADEVTPLGGEPMTFRRGTDYIACPSCHSVYAVKDLRSGRTPQQSLVGRQQSGESLVDTLERLLERRERDEEPD